MRAITQQRYGGPEVLGITTLPDPEVGAHDVLVEVRAAAVTQGDLRLRSGDFGGLTWLPARLALGLTGPRAPVPGSMIAGRIVAVGAEVTRFSPGDDVFGAPLAGGYAERVRLRDDATLARMPAGWSFAEAAALPYGAGTAKTFLDRAELRAGERIAVLGAAGGVGRFVVQLARHRGAHVVAVARPGREDLLRELGAHEVLARLDELGGTCHVLFDTTGSLTARDARRWLGPEGRLVTLEVTLAALLAVVLRPLLGGPRVITGAAFDDAASLEALRALAEAGAFRPRLGPRFALADTPLAHAHLERDRAHDVIVEPPAA